MHNQEQLHTCVIAFSGGLDTSFLVPYMRERYGCEKIVTCTVDTGGFTSDERRKIEARSKELGASKHVLLEREQEYFEQIIKYLIFGNVTRDGYPLCVGAERVIQAQAVLGVALQESADAVVHGSTGAGNDQFRFDTAIHVLGKGAVRCLAPIRNDAITRSHSMKRLQDWGYSVSANASDYSYNVGLWGVSIGGAETHDASLPLPEPAWYSHDPAEGDALKVEIQFDQGIPSSLRTPDGAVDGPVSVIKALQILGARFAIGRHYHVGTSIVGKKGRIAYESPAADILYEAHRTLEKVTLTQQQIFGKRQAADEYGRLLHEAKFFEPYLDDLKALLESSQRRVTGTAAVTLSPRAIEFVGVNTPHNLLSAGGARYGESSEAYDGRDAAGACRLHSLEQALYQSVA